MWREAALRAGEGGLGLFVAEDTGQIVGFAAGGPERTGDPRYMGELYAIYVLHAVQGRGTGRTLAHRVGQALLAAEIRTMLVWVLAANHGARRFYEALGGRYVREQPTEIFGSTYPEVAYGWQDLAALVARLAAPLP